MGRFLDLGTCYRENLDEKSFLISVYLIYTLKMVFIKLDIVSKRVEIYCEQVKQVNIRLKPITLVKKLLYKSSRR